MASTFPGTTSPFQGSTSGMHSVQEEDENDPVASPTSSHFPRNTMASAPPAASSSTFGNFEGFGSSTDSSEPKNLPNNYNLNRRTSVSAESLSPAGASDDNWRPPSHDKTTDQNDRLRKAVTSNFLFSHLDDEQSNLVLGALQEKPIPAKGIKVIQQGDTGDFFYIVERGNFDIFVNKTGRVESGADGIGDKVASCGPGNSFGELALMYNAPRAATVVSTEPSMLWALDRITFRRILMDSAFQRRRMYESFLEEVPLLASLKAYERSKIADALETQKYAVGQAIIREGDPGESFFILESGEAEVFKEAEKDTVLRTYTKGDYFGELALLNDAPRAASVIAKTEVKVATLGKDGFQRLLGPVESIMRRNDPSRQPVEEVDPLSKS
jgi:cAMP-dependent protein kinase regulator